MASFAVSAKMRRPPQPKHPDLEDPDQLPSNSNREEEDGNSTCVGSTPEPSSTGSTRSPSLDSLKGLETVCWEELNDGVPSEMWHDASEYGFDKDSDYVEVCGSSYTLQPSDADVVDADPVVPDLKPSLLCPPSKPCITQDWVAEACRTSLEGLACDSPYFNLLGARIVHDALRPTETQALYKDMGMRDPKSTYAVLWIDYADASLVLLSSLPDSVASPDAPCLLEAFLMRRLQLVVNCLHPRVSLPWTASKSADKLGGHLRRKLTSCTRSCSPAGVDHLCFRVDLGFSRLQAKLLETVGFRPGNSVEMILVDSTSRMPFVTCQLTVTQEFLRLLRSEVSCHPVRTSAITEIRSVAV